MTGNVLERAGRWQVALLVLIGFNYVIVAINHALPTFHGYTPKFHCQLDADTNITRDNGCVATTEGCPGGYHFESLRNENSIVTEWSLVCDRRLLRPLVATLYFCGVTLGAPVGGMMADRYGRRPVMLTCLYCQGALGLLLYVINSLTAFTIVRFIQGFFVQALQGSTYALLMELFPARDRTAVGIILELYWAVGLSVLAGCAYFLPDWRTLQLALTVPTILTLPYVCLVPESARWLKTRGRHMEAEHMIKRFARLNSFGKLNEENYKKVAFANGKVSENIPFTTIVSNITNGAVVPASVALSVNRVGDVATIRPSHESDKSLPADDDTAMLTEKCARDMASAVGADQDLLSRNGVTTGRPADKDMASCNDDSENVPSKQVVMIATSLVKSENSEMTGNGDIIVEKKNGVLDLFRSNLLRNYSIIMIFIWFSVSLSYYGIMFYLPDLSGDRHLNFFLGAVLEVLSYGLAYVVLTRFGRRIPLAGYLMLSGLLCASVGILGEIEGSSVPSYYPGLQTALALLGKAAVVSSFCTIFIYTAELFPTVVRAAAMGICAFGGRVGSLLAPQLLLLGEYTTNVIPLVSMGMLGVLAGLATLRLPETLNCPLADTVQQAENVNRTSKDTAEQGRI